MTTTQLLKKVEQKGSRPFGSAAVSPEFRLPDGEAGRGIYFSLCWIEQREKVARERKRVALSFDGAALRAATFLIFLDSGSLNGF